MLTHDEHMRALCAYMMNGLWKEKREIIVQSINSWTDYRSTPWLKSECSDWLSYQIDAYGDTLPRSERRVWRIKNSTHYIIVRRLMDDVAAHVRPDVSFRDSY